VIVTVAVMIYTVQGGLVASIFTDLVQTILLIPLLVVTAAVAVVKIGGFGPLFTQLQSGAPELMSLSNPGGVRFGVYIIIALIGAEMLNQSLWQRAHSGRDKRTLQLSFVGAIFAVIPMTILAGSYGVFAQGLSGVDVTSPSAALPAVIQAIFGPTMQLAFVILALLVIASTLDNALSAIVSILSVDIVPRIDPDRTGDDLLRVARVITVIIAALGIAIALSRPSVLFLLLRADLLAAATVVPVLLGLYTAKLGGIAAFSGALVGILSGIPWFLRENYLFSFSTALVVSSVVCVVWLTVSPADFDFEELKEIENLDYESR
jgi:Na+/proline symporter